MAFLVLQDIPAVWKTEDLAFVLDSFRRNDLQAILVSTNSFGGPANLGSVDALSFAGTINEDLIEVVSVAPKIYRKQRYWHLRAAHDLRLTMINSEAGNSVPETFVRSATYFERPSAPTTDLSAYRSAGFRVRIVCPEVNAPANVVADGRDQLSITGGQRLDLFDPGLGAALAALPLGEEFVVLHLSLAGGAGLSGEALVRAAENSVGQIAAELGRLGSYPTLPRDFFLLGGIQVPRDFALLLDVADADGNIASFAEDLIAQTLPFSRMASVSIPGDCAEALSTDEALLADCVASSHEPLVMNAAATVVLGGTEVAGLGPDIRMHFGLLGSEAVARLDRLTLAESDLVMRIGVQDVANPLARSRLLRRLKDGQDRGQVRLHDVPSLRDRVMASDPLIRRYWSLRRRRRSDPMVAAPPDATERTRLMEDAALAWSYFERHIYPVTGLAAGTVSAVPGGRVNSEVTLWDVGTQINALIAAADLRLVDSQVSADMILRTLAAVPTNRLEGGRFPPSNFSAETLMTAVPGFDSCDAGRLGIALSRAVSKGLIKRADVLVALNDWALDQAVRFGGHFSNIAGTWQDKSQSHCTDYIIPGLAFFGLDVLPQQGWADNSAETEVTFLYHAASIGAISTEPYALQVIELGRSGPTQLILDALFDAQISWFEAMGELRCVSETPIDREPWFLYSGLQLDIEGPEAWVIGTLKNDVTAANIGERVELISSKAAYLWKAVYPHPYSDLLVEIVREHARIPGHGFSVGVYSDTKSPVRDYTDINTNGIILSAIAHILEDR